MFYCSCVECVILCSFWLLRLLFSFFRTNVGVLFLTVTVSTRFHVQIPVVPQCVTSAFISTAAHSVTSAALASTKCLVPAFPATAAVMQTLVAPPRSVTLTQATASSASTIPVDTSVSSVLLGSLEMPKRTTASGWVKNKLHAFAQCAQLYLNRQCPLLAP